MLLLLVTGAWGAWSPSSFADGDFRVQNPAAALFHGELWSFGGRGFDSTVPSPPFAVTDQAGRQVLMKMWMMFLMLMRLMVTSKSR